MKQNLFLRLGSLALMIGTAQAAELRTEPTFHSCSVYWDGEAGGNTRLEYRVDGDKNWQSAAALVNSPNNPLWRTSLLGLRENTAYEVRLTGGSKAPATKTFRTWNDSVPVARTITLGIGSRKITEKGRPDGWIRLIAPARGIEGGNTAEAALTIENSAYVILENAVVTGGRRHAIQVVNSHQVRIVNCDLSGWGRLGKRDFRRRGIFYDDRKQAINYDAGVNIDNSSGTVIERCYFHDPRGTANSWLYAHPSGPCAVWIKGLGGTVIRYNDMIGSDRHRWNDVIEGNGNGDADGGFTRDADIYGNLMLLGNDDGVELDGGQMNVRVWGNQFEGSLCGVSTAPCIYGPSYIWNNLFVRPGDEDGVTGSAFKNNYSFCGQGKIYLYHNTMVNKDGLSPFGNGDKPRRYIEAVNNVYDCRRSLIAPSLLAEGNRFDHDLYWLADTAMRERFRQLLAESRQETHGVAAAPRYVAAEKGDFRLAPGSLAAVSVPGLGQFAAVVGIKDEMPLRPTPLTLDCRHLDFAVMPGTTATLTARLSAGPARQFRILQNAANEWFEVLPATGTLTPGQDMVLTVNLRQPAAKTRLKGAFAVKLDDGFSRPVTVYAGEGTSPKITAATPGVTTVIEAESAQPGHPFALVAATDASGGKVLHLNGAKNALDESKVAVYRFTVPADGWYYPAVCFRPGSSSDLASFYFRIDDEKFGMALMRYSAGWCWAGVTDRNDKTKKGWFEPIKLTAGEHRLAIAAKDNVELDAFAILTDPRTVTGIAAMTMSQAK